ncbi:MAG TPA: hypothetical protein VNB67_10670 [Nitrososphaeraceae archaeon]|jgi:hypothetical protein|nr:hypothetical protein [Nitrososphaeraceae archaeon]
MLKLSTVSRLASTSIQVSYYVPLSRSKLVTIDILAGIIRDVSYNLFQILLLEIKLLLNINTYLVDSHLIGTISNDLQLQKNKVISNPESDLHN